MVPSLPFWMRQRQFKVEPAGDAAIKLQAPNLPAFEVSLQTAGENHWWSAVKRVPTEGEAEVVAESERFLKPNSAWEAAFELLRRNVVT